MRITLATYNIHACVGADGRCDPQHTSNVVRELGADVVALQEVDHRGVDSYDLLESLRAEGGRTLSLLSGETDPQRELRLPDNHLIDPDRPLNSSVLSDAVVGERSLPHARRRIWLGAGKVLRLLVGDQPLLGCLAHRLAGLSDRYCARDDSRSCGDGCLRRGNSGLGARRDLKHFLVAALALVFIVGLTLLAHRLFSRMYG